MKNKITFHKSFSGRHNLLELLCLVDNLVDFLLDYLELPMFINASLPLNTLLDDVDRALRQQKIFLQKIFLGTIYIVLFFLGTVMDDLNLQLIATLVENKYCTEKHDYVHKNVRSPHHIKRILIVIDIQFFIFGSTKKKWMILEILIKNISKTMTMSNYLTLIFGF